MKRLINNLVFISLALICLSCSNKDANDYFLKLKRTANGKTVVVRLQQQWYANSGFAGELVAQYKTAAKYNLQIEVIPGSDQIDTKQIVKLGEAEFGVAGAEQIMIANEKGANLVIIGVINYKSLACFISKKEKGIKKPKDLERFKIGTMEGTPVDLVYQALKKKENLEIDKSNEIPTGWVLTGFIDDQYDVYPAFINDEPITLKLKGIDLNILEPSLYGINLIGTVYFTKRELVDCCPEVVQSFVSAVADGWDLAIKDPEQAIDFLKRYDSGIDEKKELESLKRGIDYYKGEQGKILYTSAETWNEMAKLLESIQYLNTFDKETTIENKFISWYHNKTKRSE